MGWSRGGAQHGAESGPRGDCDGGLGGAGVGLNTVLRVDHGVTVGGVELLSGILLYYR